MEGLFTTSHALFHDILLKEYNGKCLFLLVSVALCWFRYLLYKALALAIVQIHCSCLSGWETSAWLADGVSKENSLHWWHCFGVQWYLVLVFIGCGSCDEYEKGWEPSKLFSLERVASHHAIKSNTLWLVLGVLTKWWGPWQHFHSKMHSVPDLTRFKSVKYCSITVVGKTQR